MFMYFKYYIFSYRIWSHSFLSRFLSK